MELRVNVKSDRPPAYLGVDAGQTHLEAVFVSPEGELLACGKGGPSHVPGARMDEVFERSLQSALESAAFGDWQVIGIGMGVTGLGIPGKRDAVLSFLQKLFPNVPVYMDNDAVVSHWGATGGMSGTTVLAGTGTIIYGEYEGRTERLGGWGYLFGDEGGGSWIGLNAIRAALRATEGRSPETTLVSALEHYFDVSSVKKIPGLFYSGGSVNLKQIAELAKLVCREAANGDAVAKDIVLSAADELGGLTCRLLKMLNVSAESDYPVYRLGGIWRAGDLLNGRYMQIVHEAYPRIVWPEPKYKPAVGAALMAQAMRDTNQASKSDRRAESDE